MLVILLTLGRCLQVENNEDAKPWEMASIAGGMIKKAATEVVEAVKSRLPWEMESAYVAPPPIKLTPARTVTDVLPALIQAESSGDHSKVNAVSGARGLTQILPDVAKKPGYGVAPLKDASEKEAKRFTTDYLGAMLSKFEGDMPKALAAYNSGVGNVMKAVEKGGEQWMDFLPKRSETLPYIDKILKTTYAEGLARKGAR